MGPLKTRPQRMGARQARVRAPRSAGGLGIGKRDVTLASSSPPNFWVRFACSTFIRRIYEAILMFKGGPRERGFHGMDGAASFLEAEEAVQVAVEASGDGRFLAIEAVEESGVAGVGSNAAVRKAAGSGTRGVIRSRAHMVTESGRFRRSRGLWGLGAGDWGSWFWCGGCH